MRYLRSFSLWCAALLCVVVVALIVAPKGSDERARIAHLESIVRCPSCDDLSVAESDQTSALAVRHEIAQRVHQGKSDNEILTSLEKVYGTSILLSPPTSGLGILLWLVPLLGLLLLIGSAVRLSRRH